MFEAIQLLDNIIKQNPDPDIDLDYFVKQGVIPWKVPFHYDICNYYNTQKSTGINTTNAVAMASEKFDITEGSIYRILREMNQNGTAIQNDRGQNDRYNNVEQAASGNLHLS